MEKETKDAFLELASKNGFSPVNMQPNQNGGAFHPGITLREYFAAMALQGILANTGRISKHGNEAIMAVTMADDLLFALER